jgi:hypothetical protein
MPQGDDLKALTLEASDYLAGQPSGEGVGLYEDQGSHHDRWWVEVVGPWMADAARERRRAADRPGSASTASIVGGV